MPNPLHPSVSESGVKKLKAEYAKVRLTPIRAEILRAISRLEADGTSAPTVAQIAEACGRAPSAHDLFTGRLRGMAFAWPPLVGRRQLNRWEAAKYPMTTAGRQALAALDAKGE